MTEEGFKMHFGSALMFAYEMTAGGPPSSAWRSSSYLPVTANFTTVVGLTTVLYYQSRLFDASDLQVALEAGLLLDLTKRVTFESRSNVLKDTERPAGIQPGSHTWNNRSGFRS